MYTKATIGNVLDSVSKKYSGRTAIIFDDKSVSYSDISKISNIVALNLWKLGIRKNDKVSVIMPNSIEYFYLYNALFIIGAWIVPISTRYEKDEIKRVMLNSNSNMVIYKNRIGVLNYDHIFESIIAALPALKFIVSSNLSETTNNGPLRTLIPSLFDDICITNDDKDNFQKYLLENPVNPGNIAILGYTSGTTGHPKGVMISHQNLVHTSMYAGMIMDIKEDIGFSIAPLYAAQGFNAILIYLVSGITMKWISTFNPADVLTHIVKNNINAFHTQPTMWNLVLNLPYFRYISFKHLNKVIVSGSLCSSTLAKNIEKSTGCKLINIYGLIEATGVVTMTHLDDPEDVRLNTVGRPIPGVSIKIVDSQRKELPKGQIGELAVKGYLMEGYYNNESATKKIIDEEGWLYTGDLACFYKDGNNICIVGRLKDMIIRGGFNVYPIDIEECLANFEKVSDVSIVGNDDELLGESIVAFVIPKPGLTLTKAEILGFLRHKIANYKIPDHVIFVSQFPILDSGKVQKNILKKWLIDGIPENCKLE